MKNIKTAAKSTYKKDRFLVQLADNFGFDFGGEDQGIASFANKGDAYNFASVVRDRTKRTTRVLDTTARWNANEVFLLEPNETL